MSGNSDTYSIGQGTSEHIILMNDEIQIRNIELTSLKKRSRYCLCLEKVSAVQLLVFAEKRKEETARQEVGGTETPATFDLVYYRKMATGRERRDGAKRKRKGFFFLNIFVFNKSIFPIWPCQMVPRLFRSRPKRVKTAGLRAGLRAHNNAFCCIVRLQISFFCYFNYYFLLFLRIVLKYV